MKIKEYALGLLNDEETKMRKAMRYIKNDIKNIQSMKAACRNATEDQLMKILETEPEMMKNFKKYNEEIENRNKEAVQKMVKDGKLKEANYDSEGREIDGDGNIIKEGTTLSRKQQQFIDGVRAKSEGGSSPGSSESDESMS